MPVEKPVMMQKLWMKLGQWRSLHLLHLRSLQGAAQTPTSLLLQAAERQGTPGLMSSAVPAATCSFAVAPPAGSQREVKSTQRGMVAPSAKVEVPNSHVSNAGLANAFQTPSAIAQVPGNLSAIGGLVTEQKPLSAIV